jgi:hypothetical protein
MSQETLLSQSTIWLFGRELSDLILSTSVYGQLPTTHRQAERQETPVRAGDNNFLLRQLANPDARLARIYAFAYEGSFYDLARPTIFVVHGEGLDPEGASFDENPALGSLSRMPADPGRTGLASLVGSFSRNMLAWAYDRADFTVRLDIETGTFDTVLLSLELDDRDATARSAGSVARSAGSVARSAGSVARAAGSVARARRASNGSND